MPEYWKLRAIDPAGAYRRVYAEARELAYRALAEALISRLDVIWEIGGGGKAYSAILDWLKQLGYRITICGIDCRVEDALERQQRRFRDPTDLLHFGRDPAWYPPSQPEATDLAKIKLMYQKLSMSLERPSIPLSN
jgi:hypothetical protein